MSEDTHRGHRRCGAVSIETRCAPDFIVYCHCDDCRRATGAPVLASVGIPKAEVTWNGEAARHTIGTATRLFCRDCGSPIAQEHESKSDITFFNTGFMDNPEIYPPSYHTFAGQQLPWLQLHDDLPRVEKTLLIETN